MVLTRDGGELYVNLFSVTTNNDVTGTRIHHNWLHDTQVLIPGAAHNFPLSGVYPDEDAGGFEVDQNVFWNNQNQNFLIHGSSATPPDTLQNNNNFHNNSILDINSTGYTYTTPPTISADNGSTFTVVVSNAIGSGTSSPATLTIN